MSEIPGQSGHALPTFRWPVCANNRLIQPSINKHPPCGAKGSCLACRSLGSEIRHDRLGEPPHVLARTLAEQQHIGHALRLQRGQLACDLRR
jgi:hypothetical protein